MEKFKKIILQLIHPHFLIVILFTIISVTGLCYIFIGDYEESLFAYVIYALSFYTLSSIVVAIPPVVIKCRKKIYDNPYASRYLSEIELRARISLYSGTIINLGYAVFKLFTGIYYHSLWFGAVAVYYIVLFIIRFSLIRNDRKSNREKNKNSRHLLQWKSYFLCGWLLLILNIAITGMVVQMIWQNKGYTYAGYIIYISALYTFYRIIMAVVRIVKIRKRNNPVLLASKALDLSVALMALFSLQTAMFASFGTEMTETERRIMNTVTGGMVCLIIICIAVYMIIHSAKKIKNLKSNKTNI